MKMASVVAATVACLLMTGLSPTGAVAQSPVATDNARGVVFGNTEIVLHAPSQHCILDPSQPADQKLAALVFQPRAGNLNTYLGAFLDCQSRAALRSDGPEKVVLSSYAYYLAVTATAANPVTTPRDVLLQRVCDNVRARSGTLDLAGQSAKGEIEAKMQALPIGRPWFGPIVAQDVNGCYQVVLYKSLASGIEHREAMLTISTFVNRRQVTFTRAIAFPGDGLSSFVSAVRTEVASFLKLNP